MSRMSLGVNVKRASQVMILLNQSLLFLNVCTELCSGFYQKDEFIHRWADRKKQFLK